MNKILRYSFVALMAMVFGNSYAVEGTDFLFDQNYSTLFPTLKGTSSNESHDGDFTEATTSTSVDGFTVTVSAADEGASAANRIWQNSPRLRLYSGTLTVKGKGIKQIVFSINGTKKFNLTPSTGTLTDMVWKGETDEVVFTVGGTTQLSSLTINGDYDPSTPEVPTAANIEALNALANNTAFTFTGEAQVVYLNGRYAYIKDATGSSLIYDSSTEKLANLALGKKIAANWTGKVSLYNNLFEAVPDGVLAVTEDAPVEVVYPEAAITDAVAANMNQIVILKGVTYTAPDGKNFTISKGGVDVKGYNQFGLEIAAPEAEKSYDITGVISVYKTDVQFQPIKIEEATSGGGSDPTPSGDFYAWEEGMSAANKLTFADGSTVQITGNLEKTIGSAKKITIDGNEYTTLKISNGAENTFTLPAGKKAKGVTFYSYVNKATAEAADRENYWADVNGTAYDAAAKGTMKDFTDSEDYLLHPDVYTFELAGVNSFTFKNAGYQPCIVIRVALDDPSNITTVKTAVIDGTRYNLAGQKVDESYKGIVIMNGKKMIQK